MSQVNKKKMDEHTEFAVKKRQVEVFFCHWSFFKRMHGATAGETGLRMSGMGMLSVGL